MKDKEITKPKIKEEKTPEKEEKRKVGRPTILTPELKAKLVRLFEEHFFLWIVSAKADIYKYHIYDWRREQKDFDTAVTHAQGKWIAQQMELLDEYAIDKKTKDWRALKYKLSIANAEFNDKKYLKEAPGKRDSTQITIVISQKDLKTSKIEADKIVGEGRLEEEEISLMPFLEEKKEKEEKKGEKEETGNAKT